jgi:hypothetical protein
MWYTKNLRIAQVNNALQNFKDLLKANEYIGLSDLVIGVDGYDPKDENKMFTFTLNNQQKAETNINKVKSKNLELNTAANSASNTNTTDNSKKIEIKRAPDDVPGIFKFLLDGDPIRIGDDLYKFKLGGEEYTGNFLQMNDILKNEFERIKSVQKSSGDYQLVTQNKGQPSQPGSLVSPKAADNKYGWNISTEDIENYNKLVGNKFTFKVTAIPAPNSPKGHTVKVEYNDPPSGTETLVSKLKQNIENESIFTLPTDGGGTLVPLEYNITFDTKTEFTPAQFQKTFVTPTLINSRIGDPIKLKIDGRDIKNVRNGENVILDPNDLYLTEGKHIIEFVSNNADKNLNADKSDFLSYQVNVTDGQKLSLIGSARGSFPQLYNRSPLSTEKQRIEQRVKDQRKAPTQETPDEKEGIQEALRTEAIENGLLTRVYNTAMQKYDFNEVEQYFEEIMRNRALYATPQKRKDYAESLKRERGRVRQQSPVDALLQPRPTQPGA